ncbi:MBOAT, membrane-bound O-acyltransferase family-domain-containing protein, partial [Thamnocephalis sphaerospora]
YQPRRSRLDREHMVDTRDQFRGFFTLFWTTMACYVTLTVVRNFSEHGVLLGGALFDIFSTDALTLIASDAIMVGATTLAVPLSWLESRGWISRIPFLLIQLCYETAFIVGAVYWTLWRSWPWVQTTFFVLHSIVMLMKLHSYLARNHELAWMNTRTKLLRNWLQRRERGEPVAELSSGTSSGASASASPLSESPVLLPADAPAKVVQDAQAVAAAVAAATLDTPTDGDGGNATAITTGASTGIATGSLRQRRSAATGHADSDVGDNSTSAALLADADTRIRASDARQELAELEDDLGVGKLTYPHNITPLNFFEYLVIPSLVYELNYPRSDRIRPGYLFEKIAAILGTFTLLYMMVEHYVLPALYGTAHLPIWHALPQLLCPTLVVFLLCFFIIFEFICNAFAELSFFADRSFYDDWWNSTTFDEFARNWNKPVHHFLLRHVYVPLYRDCGLSRSHASLLTFLISSIFHELAIAVVCGHVRMYLFSFQMLQIPLISMTRLAGRRVRETIGNWFFWFSMAVGPPLLLCLY